MQTMTDSSRFGVTNLTTEGTYPSSGDRIAALIAHGGPLVAWTLAPLIVYLVKRGDSKWVEYQALSSLLWSLGGTIVSLATCGLAIPLFMVWHIIALVKTASGEHYEYPVAGAVARDLVYGKSG
jgi:uncharacterized Tic20 family protein